MRSIDAVAVGSIADTITLLRKSLVFNSPNVLIEDRHGWTKGTRRRTYINTNILGLGDPVTGDAAGAKRRKAIDVPGRGAAVVVDVAGQAGLVVRVADEEDALDGVEGGTGQLGQGVHGRGCALRVAF